MKLPPSYSRPRLAARHARAEETRAAILHAATNIFAREGLAGARTDAIARAACVNKALLYYYFKSKDDLYRAVLEEHLQEFSRRALEVLSQRTPAGATVLRFATMHFDFISARPYYPLLFQRFSLSGGETLRRLARRYFAPVRRRLIALLARGIRSGEFRRVDCRHMAISLVGVTVFYFVSAPIAAVIGNFNPYEAANLRRRKEEVLSFIRYGLFRHPGEVPP
ncbi:MAG: TetR/AcrR family transcriptional regulator [Terriglobia bacterium]